MHKLHFVIWAEEWMSAHQNVLALLWIRLLTQKYVHICSMLAYNQQEMWILYFANMTITKICDIPKKCFIILKMINLKVKKCTRLLLSFMHIFLPIEGIVFYGSWGFSSENNIYVGNNSTDVVTHTLNILFFYFLVVVVLVYCSFFNINLFSFTNEKYSFLCFHSLYFSYCLDDLHFVQNTCGIL